MHNHKCNEWYHYDVDKEECMVEKTLLGESSEEIVHEVSPLCLELVEYIYCNSLNLITVSSTFPPPFLTLMYKFLRRLGSFMINDADVDSRLLETYFDMQKQNVSDVIQSLGVIASTS